MSIKIVAKVSGDKFESAKNLLRAFKESSNTIDISAVRYGNLGEDRLLSFNEIVVRFSKDIRSGLDILNKARGNIDIAIQTAIDRAYNKGIRSTFDTNNSLEQLLKIASDKNLKVLSKQELQKKAGLKALELCGSNYEQSNNLIQICNNNLLPYFVCLKAAAKLCEILENNQEIVQEEILYATKHLNVRWINIALDIMGPEMHETEFQSVTRLINLVQQIQS